MKAVGYARVTEEELENSDQSLEEQTLTIQEYAKAQGLQLKHVFVDGPVEQVKKGVDLSHLCSRSGFFKVLEEGSAHRCDVVVVTAFDRINRMDLSFNPLVALECKEKRLVLVGEKLYVKRELAKARRRKFSKELSVAERLLAGRKRAAEKGYHQSGPAPYGYRRNYRNKERHCQLELHPKESPIVAEIFREYLKKKSIAKVMKHLAKQGSKTRRGRDWSRAGISWILKNETYLGRVHFGDVRAKGNHPPIISQIVFNKANKQIRINNKRGGAVRKRDL